MAGWPPPGPPRFFAGLPGLRRRILSVPPESDRVPGVRTAIVTSTGLLDPRLPPRPMVSRTRSSPTSTPSSIPRTAPPGPPRRTPRPRSSTPGTAAGSPRTVAIEQINWCTKSVSLSRLLGRRRAPDRALLPTCSPSPGSAPPRPIRWTKGLLYNTRHVGPPRPDDSLPSTSGTAPPGPSRPIRLRPRPGDSPHLPATYDRPFRPSSRSLSR
jgi:hypothetical protein